MDDREAESSGREDAPLDGGAGGGASNARAPQESHARDNDRRDGTPPQAGGVTLGWLRTTAAALLIALGALLLPAGIAAQWGRGLLSESDTFVDTFGDLASDPDVQSLVGDQVMAAIESRVDIDGLVGAAFDALTSAAAGDSDPGSARSRAAGAVLLLRGPTAAALRSTLRDGVDSVVQSDRFADLWRATLRISHERATAILRGEPGTVVSLSSDGVLAIELGPIVNAVRDTLQQRGWSFADRISQTDRAIPVIQSNELAQTKLAYRISMVVGAWAIWVALVLLAAGVLVARRPLRTLPVAAICAGGAALLALGLVRVAAAIGAIYLGTGTIAEPAARVLINDTIDGLERGLASGVVWFLAIAAVVWLTPIVRSRVTWRPRWLRERS